MSASPDLQRVWDHMDSYLRKLYGEAALLDTNGVPFEVERPDDRPGFVAGPGAYRTQTRIALEFSGSGEYRWFDDHEYDGPWRRDRPPVTYYDTLQEAWDALHTPSS